MGNITVTFCMDENLKQQFENICSRAGTDMTAVFIAFVKKTVQDNRLPFELNCKHFNTETVEAIKEVELMKKNHAVGKTYTKVDDMIVDIIKDTQNARLYDPIWDMYLDDFDDYEEEASGVNMCDVLDKVKTEAKIEGKMEAYFDYVLDGFVSVEVAAKKEKMSVEAFSEEFEIWKNKNIINPKK